MQFTTDAVQTVHVLTVELAIAELVSDSSEQWSN